MKYPTPKNLSDALYKILFTDTSMDRGQIYTVFTCGPRRENTWLRGFVNKKGTDQPARMRSLIRAFVFRYWKVLYLDLQQTKFQFSS